jgi:BirA family biotin operon repressor/biotin-[acetyl-CoA-carboxylase] ligase
MRKIDMANPFGAAVYWEETVSSTMDEARRLAGEGAAHGTVTGADFQRAGRGRVRDRPWLGGEGESLFATIILRYPGPAAIPAALTLRTGLAVAAAVEDFAPPLAGRVLVKWPNDIMICSLGPGTAEKAPALDTAPAVYTADAARKAAGILAEGDGKTVCIGFGVNVAQAGFPGELGRTAVSIAMALGQPPPAASADAATQADAAAPDSPADTAGPEGRFVLLEKILARLYRELEDPAGGGASWLSRLEARLYMRGEPVRFIDGAAGSGRVVEGVLSGVGKNGELLITPPGAGEARPFITGELDIYGRAYSPNK